MKVGASGIAPLGVTGSVRGDLASCATGSSTLPSSRPNAIAVGIINSIVASPNPARGVTTITIGQILNNATIRMLGITGDVITEKFCVYGPSFQMDMTGKAGGLYTIEVIQNGNIQMLKLMKP